MKFIEKVIRRFGKKSEEKWRALSREEIIERMSGIEPEGFAKEVTEVIYSKDRTMRYVILRDGNGLFTYCLEKLHLYDHDEGEVPCGDFLPAMWVPYEVDRTVSVFGRMEEVKKEMRLESEYRQYFEKA